MSLSESFRNDWYRAANIVTSVRLLLFWVPAALLLSNPSSDVSRWWATGAFLAIALTDNVDGYIARRFTQVTEWGKFLDPLVDKLLVATTLIALAVVYPVLWGVVVFVFIREVVVTLQIRMSRKGEIVAAVWSGKIKMLLQVVMIIVWLIPGGGVWSVVRLVATLLAVAATFYSWIDYTKRFTN